MRRWVSIAGMLAVAILASGCSSSMSSMLGGDEPAQPVNAQAAPDLSMPPDLQLRAPGTYTPPPAAAAPAEPVPGVDYSQTAAATPPAQPAATGDVYERNGISKVKPDGTKKSQAELDAELREIYMAKKRASNPNYGTVFNIGNIFKDE